MTQETKDQGKLLLLLPFFMVCVFGRRAQGSSTQQVTSQLRLERAILVAFNLSMLCVRRYSSIQSETLQV